MTALEQSIEISVVTILVIFVFLSLLVFVTKLLYLVAEKWFADTDENMDIINNEIFVAESSTIKRAAIAAAIIHHSQKIK